MALAADLVVSDTGEDGGGESLRRSCFLAYAGVTMRGPWRLERHSGCIGEARAYFRASVLFQSTPRILMLARKSVSRTRAAFTLLEILIALAILALLVGLAVTKTETIFGGAQVTTAKLFVNESMATPLTTYRLHMGDYPTTAEGLQALITPPQGKADRWHGPYMEARGGKLPLDPWGNPYQYRYPGTHNKGSYDLFSFGPDGVENENDIGNW